MLPESLPEPGVFEEIAIELGVDPAFVEKDWYATQVLVAISGIQPGPITPVFAGGTCLSKAYQLIKRFSEDLDFRGHFGDSKASKAVRRQFREKVLAAVEAVDGIELDRSLLERGSSYFKFPLSYANVFSKPAALRPNLQVEFSYTQPRKTCDIRSISSFVAMFSKRDPETQIPCLSPIETAADKFCALTWRVLKRDRGSEGDDPAMIRHMHDLCALHPLIETNLTEFTETAKQSFETDMALSRRKLEENLADSSRNALMMLRDDALYADEYEQFVAGMSYSPDDERLPFNKALASLEAIVNQF